MKSKPKAPPKVEDTSTREPTKPQAIYVHGDVIPGEHKVYCGLCPQPGWMPLLHWIEGHPTAVHMMVRSKMIERAKSLISQFPGRFVRGATEALTGPTFTIDDAE